MKKSKKMFEVVIESYGLYTQWKGGSRDLPKIIEFTSVIKAYEGNEFGVILRIRKGKGVKLDYYIKRPAVNDEHNITENDYTGMHIVRSNDYKFFIGDCIDYPVQDKLGKWIISIYSESILLAEKSFDVVLP